MATYSYTQIADYILDQLFGYASANALKNSVRYIAEDILKHPAGNSDKISALDMDNGATHGGRVNFDGGTTKYIESNAAGTTFGIEGFTAVSANAMAIIWSSTTRPSSTAPGTRGVAISATSGGFSTASTTFVDVTNLSVTLVTNGRPVFLTLIPGVSASDSYVLNDYDGSGNTSRLSTSLKIVRDSTDIAFFTNTIARSPADTTWIGASFPSGGFTHVDAVTAGTYVYKVQGKANAGFETNLEVLDLKLVAFEL
jgi:hypothetical protein